MTFLRSMVFVRHHAFKSFSLAHRQYCLTNAPKQKIPIKLVSQLKKETELPLNKCREALENNNGNYDSALAWINDNLSKMGAAKAKKLEGRVATEGKVEIAIENDKAVMIEINCETDFVSKNESFKEVVLNTAMEALKKTSSNIGYKAMDLNVDEIKNDPFVNEKIMTLISKLGEKITLRRGIQMSCRENELFGFYNHGGRVGALVKIEYSDKEKATSCSKQLASHIAGLNPQTIDQLTSQEFLFDGSITVAEYLNNEKAKIVDFRRFECGEGMEKKIENFSDEVEKLTRQ